MSVRITYFVHGTTTDNEQHRATGTLHGELSEFGVENAKDLARQAADKHFDMVFCSDLKRAVVSAELGFGGTYQITQDPLLRECDYVDKPFPGGQSYRDVESQIRKFCDYLKKNYDGKHVAIVAHQAPQLAFEVVLNDKTWRQAIDGDWRRSKRFQPGGWEYRIR